MPKEITVFHATTKQMGYLVKNHNLDLIHAYTRNYPTGTLAGDIRYSQPFLKPNGVILEYSIPENELIKCDVVSGHPTEKIRSDWYASAWELHSNKWNTVPHSYREVMKACRLISDIDQVESWPANLVISYVPHAYLVRVKESLDRYLGS